MKKTKQDIQRIQAFYDKKFSEYITQTMEQLAEAFKDKSMSRTQRLALEDAALYIKMHEHKIRAEKEKLEKEEVKLNQVND